MKKSILIAMLAALMSQNIFAQQNPQGVKKQKQDKQERVNKEGRQRWSAEQMVQMQTARLTNELMLDDANAAKFKDIYQSYQKDLQTVRQKYHPKRDQAQKSAEGEKPQMKERKQITDQDIEERILNQMKEQKEMLSVKESYYAKFRKVLSNSVMLAFGLLPQFKHIRQYCYCLSFCDAFQNVQRYFCSVGT